MPVELRLAEDDVDTVMVFRAAEAMHSEGIVPGGLDAGKTFENICRMVKDGAVLMAMDGDTLCGFLALFRETYWYSQEKFWGDKALFVLPKYRGTEAVKVLLEGAIYVSNATGLPVFITINNIQRRRGPRSEWERQGATLGFHPQGAALAHFPGA